jgi:hypothetical protein
VLRAVTENVMLGDPEDVRLLQGDCRLRSDRSNRRERRRVAGRGFSRNADGAVRGPVELFDPFKNVAFDAKRFQVDVVDAIAPTAAVAVGLALRRAADR